MGMEIEIDRDLCMGSGNCVYEAPGVFALDGDGIAVVIDPNGAAEEILLGAQRRCPTQAITIRRGDPQP